MTQSAPPTRGSHVSMKKEVSAQSLTDTQRGKRQDSMKASPCTPQCFLNQRISLPLLALVFMMTWHFAVTESAPPIQFRGEVGGNVTIDCPFDKHRNITLFYFQKKQTAGEDIFVNGYHTSRNISNRQKNTRVDHGKPTVHMHSLNISDSGDYSCVISYSVGKIDDTVIQLTITANYSKPKVTQWCSDGVFCQVTCASYGGYPQTKITWSQESTMMRVVNSSGRSDSATMLFSSFSTADFNCSSGELKHLSCSVGEVTSDLFSVCTSKDPPDLTVIIAAACTVLFVLIIVLMAVWWKCKKGQARRNVPLEWGPTVSEGEGVNLTDTNVHEEAP